MKLKKPVGLLRFNKQDSPFQLSLLTPAADLAYFIEHYWIVRWDLRGKEPFLQENLTHPSVHLVFERGNSRIHGVVKGKFSILLQDEGVVFGVKFRPGAFYPFVQYPVSRLSGRTIPFQEIFSMDGRKIEQDIFSENTPDNMLLPVEQFIRKRLPDRDPLIDRLQAIIDCIRSDRSIVKVDEIVSLFSIPKRQLQLLFHRYVGVSPKWLIQRYRLHEAVESMAMGSIPDWSRLALDLGYYDQSHLIRDFRSIVGQPPEQYVESLANLKHDS